MNLILTGFMGTGKSTAGRLVAERLCRPFIDVDVEIERRTGRSIPQLFAEEGEATFRALERALCQELAEARELVIATGGGALVDPVSREAMMRTGFVICLTASPENLLARLQHDTGRPLLQAPDPAARLRALLEARAASYAALPHHLNTDSLTPEQVAEAILTLWHTRST